MPVISAKGIPSWCKRCIAPRPASKINFCSPTSTSVLGPNLSTLGGGAPLPRRVIRKISWRESGIANPYLCATALTADHQGFNETALIQLSYQSTIGEFFRLRHFRLGYIFLELQQEIRDARRIRRHIEAVLDHHLVGFFEDFAVVGAEIFSHGLQGECFVFHAAHGSLDISLEKTSRRIFVGL